MRKLHKPSVAIVGAGNLGVALAVALHACGYSIEEVISQASEKSLRRSRKLARAVAPFAVNAANARLGAHVVWFCVPDSAIAGAAKSLSAGTNWKEKIAFHSSGALTSGELSVLRKLGASVASVHPLMTFVRGSRPSFLGVPFAIEGNRKAVAAARSIVRDLGGIPYAVAASQKEAYHAWGMFVSPLLAALLAAAERVAEAAHVDRKQARSRAVPILRQTLENYARLGAGESFSGPIARGDVSTVKKHLNVLKKIPPAREVYVALARAALRDLPAKNRRELKKLLGN